MSVTISIRFLTGRAHLHPWQTHHSEGRVEWPPSQWRLLRALVAVAGRGLTSLPQPDFVADAGKKPKATKKNPSPIWPAQGYESFPDNWSGNATDEIPLSSLAGLLHALSASPTIWLPKSSGGHTRQYFPTGDPDTGRWIKPTGSPVFDTFATVRKDQPLLFHWPNSNLSDQQLADLRLLLSRMTYFGRAESWCRAEAHLCPMEKITAEGMSEIVAEKTHWECRCIEDYGKPNGQEYRDYLLERRLAPIADLKIEVPELLPRTNSSDGKKRKPNDADTLKALLTDESSATLLLRCLLRESGQDIKDGLERPIGTRWIHYAVPRAVYDVPRAKPQPRPRTNESVDLVRYALNTATVGRAVLPAVTDTLLVADKFRSAVMALCRQPSVALSGHEADDSPCKDHQHAYWWPMDEDNDGFIDHVLVWAPGGFEQQETDALRRLTRLRQRGGRPDLLVTPVYVGLAEGYPPWQSCNSEDVAKVFVSATPYFCPVHLSHGRGKSGRIRSLKAEVIKSLRLHGLIDADDEVFDIREVVFDYKLGELAKVLDAVASYQIAEPVPPRQYFPVIAPPQVYPPHPHPSGVYDGRYQGASLKDPDDGYCFGTSIGFIAEGSGRFIRALSFCRRRRGHEVRGHGRMLQLTFSHPRSLRPFAIGSQSHFGLGLFVPSDERETT
jgi:CRISPR-associated protein Csb2